MTASQFPTSSRRPLKCTFCSTPRSAARVVNRVGLETDKNNHLLMHAMGPNVAGVIGSAVAAGVLLALIG